MKRLAVLLMLLAAPLWAQDYPDHTSTTVNDFADLIDAGTERTIDQELAKILRETGVEFTVVTIDRQADYGGNGDIADFGTGLFNAWGVGSRERNDGVMLLVAGGDREMRLVLGAGYPRSYDWLAEDVVDTDILPLFRDGRLAEGILSGVRATDTKIIRVLAEGRTPPPRPVRSAAPPEERTPVTTLLGILLFVGVGAIIVVQMVMRRFRKCPQCGQRGLKSRTVTLDQPTQYSTGLAEVTTTCPSCGWHRVSQQVLSSLADRDRSDSNSGSGGSFGGGSSSGGGASGKW